MNISAQPVQLRYRHGTLDLARLSERSGQLRTPIQRVRALPRLDLNKHAGKLVSLSAGEAVQGLPLRFDAKASAALLSGGNPDVSNEWSRDLSGHDDPPNYGRITSIRSF